MILRVAINRVHPCPFQPRKDFSAEALKELADSIREQGIVQPLIVRARGDGFELIAGERRWRAAQLVGLNEVPVLVREADNREVLELALIENLQRENLNPIEEAQGYSQLIGQFQLTQDGAAARVGRSRAVVANALRLLKLPSEVQAHVRDGRLSVGHAKVILGLAGAEEQKLAADRVLRKSLNVRQTEELVAALQQQAASGTAVRKSPGSALAPDIHAADLQRRLQERLGTKVDLRYRQGKGALQIHFYSDADLDRVLEIIGVRPN
jgi:ParB family chromosome partitioning protein